MKFVYHMGKDSIKKVYDYMLKQSMIHSFFFFLVFFLIIELILFHNALLLGMIYYLCGSIICALILLIFTLVYRFIFYRWYQKQMEQTPETVHIHVNRTHICMQSGEDKYCLLWKDIKKIKSKKETLVILPKKHQLVMLFEKKYFKNEEVFSEFCEKVKNYYQSMV